MNFYYLERKGMRLTDGSNIKLPGRKTSSRISNNEITIVLEWKPNRLIKTNTFWIFLIASLCGLVADKKRGNNKLSEKQCENKQTRWLKNNNRSAVSWECFRFKMPAFTFSSFFWLNRLFWTAKRHRSGNKKGLRNQNFSRPRQDSTTKYNVYM